MVMAQDDGFGNECSEDVVDETTSKILEHKGHDAVWHEFCAKHVDESRSDAQESGAANNRDETRVRVVGGGRNDWESSFSNAKEDMERWLKTRKRLHSRSRIKRERESVCVCCTIDFSAFRLICLYARVSLCVCINMCICILCLRLYQCYYCIKFLTGRRRNLPPPIFCRKSFDRYRSNDRSFPRCLSQCSTFHFLSFDRLT